MKNPFAQAPHPLQITMEAELATLDAIECMVEDLALAITRPLDMIRPQMILLADAGHFPEIEARAKACAGAVPLTLRTLQLGETDWVSKVQKDFPPFTLGRFYVYGSHANQPQPRNHFPLLVDAASAFGTGEHATTAGCLLALEAEKRKRPHARTVADVGCGTAILAIGAARLWKNTRILACDNDPVAVRVSAHNLKVNRIAPPSEAFVSDGYKMRPIRRAPRQEVIVANILAKPLMKMAKHAAAKLAPNGTLILSGLLHRQERMVLAAHRAQGLHLKSRIRRGNWSVLVVGR